jgi:ABC-type sulfate transport system permease component
MSLKKFDAFMTVLAISFTLYMLVSLFYLFTALSDWPTIFEQLMSQRVIMALWVSITSSTIVALIGLFLGVPTSWMLAYKDFKGRSVLETLIVTIPHAYPPGVVGTAYLLMFTTSNPIGSLLDRTGIRLVNTFWAIVMVKVFISTPFLVSLLSEKFRSIRETNLEVIARSLGASDLQTFITVTLPLSYKAIVAGTGRCWARAMGEIAGTIVFAGAMIPGVTQTMPAIIVFEAQYNLPIALALALILSTFSIVILVSFRVLMERE